MHEFMHGQGPTRLPPHRGQWRKSGEERTWVVGWPPLPPIGVGGADRGRGWPDLVPLNIGGPGSIIGESAQHPYPTPRAGFHPPSVESTILPTFSLMTLDLFNLR